MYSTNEFEETRQRLKENPPSRKNLKKYIKEKDKFELEGYFKDLNGFKLTKALFAHIRRKLQMMNYFKTGELAFEPKKYVNDLDLSDKERKEFELICEDYSDRKPLSNKKIRNYLELAKQLTNKIMEN